MNVYSGYNYIVSKFTFISATVNKYELPEAPVRITAMKATADNS